MIESMEATVATTVNRVIKSLKLKANAKNVAGMARFGINTHNTLGISIYDLRRFAKEIGEHHELALELWKSGIHEARILASYIADPQQMTPKLLEMWVRDFDSWDVCDQVCNLFEQTEWGYAKAVEWAKRDEEFVKRAAFALMAGLTAHDKKAPDSKFLKFFPVIARESRDTRNFVKKAINWALRNLGKRSPFLNKKAIQTAFRIKKIDSLSARWIAADALRELKSPEVQFRLRERARKKNA